MAEDLSHVCFKDVAWLQSFPLNETTALDYFSLSQFYERTCNNEILKMQARFTDNTALLSQLTNMKGIEFAILKAQPPRLFIIAKQNRLAVDKVSILSLYYILEGSIYMAPNLNTIISNRIASSAHYLSEAIGYSKKFLNFDAGTSRYSLLKKKDAGEDDVDVDVETDDKIISPELEQEFENIFNKALLSLNSSAVVDGEHTLA